MHRYQMANRKIEALMPLNGAGRLGPGIQLWRRDLRGALSVGFVEFDTFAEVLDAKVGEGGV
jgi:hypothetical protein